MDLITCSLDFFHLQRLEGGINLASEGATVPRDLLLKISAAPKTCLYKTISCSSMFIVGKNPVQQLFHCHYTIDSSPAVRYSTVSKILTLGGCLNIGAYTGLRKTKEK